MKATPLISSTFASAVVFLLMKLAVMAIASLPRNSLRRNPEEDEEADGMWAQESGSTAYELWHRNFKMFSKTSGQTLKSQNPHISRANSCLLLQIANTPNTIRYLINATTCSVSWKHRQLSSCMTMWLSHKEPAASLHYSSSQWYREGPWYSAPQGFPLPVWLCVRPQHSYRGNRKPIQQFLFCSAGRALRNTLWT